MKHQNKDINYMRNNRILLTSFHAKQAYCPFTTSLWIPTLRRATIMNDGIADRTSNHLQPNEGITMDARTISNIVPKAQLI